MADASQFKPLRLLVDVRERERRRLDAEIASARTELQARERASRESMARRDERLAEVDSAVQERLDLVSDTFTPAAMTGLDFKVSRTRAELASAQTALAQANADLEAQSEIVATIQTRLRRVDQRIDRFKDRIATLQRDRDDAEDERVDEEAEEVAAVRRARARKGAGAGT